MSSMCATSHDGEPSLKPLAELVSSSVGSNSGKAWEKLPHSVCLKISCFNLHINTAFPQAYTHFGHNVNLQPGRGPF